MDNPCPCDFRNACDGRIVCHCLNVTADEVTRVVVALGLRTLGEVRCHTGAGDGCTACHQRLRQILAEAAQSSSSSPICSVR